jgi:hypothetical protein
MSFSNRSLSISPSFLILGSFLSSIAHNSSEIEGIKFQAAWTPPVTMNVGQKNFLCSSFQ